MKGYIQVYTGKGKGKTTAAFGLALRATGAGLTVYVGQFLKGSETSGIKALKNLGSCVTVEQFGRKGFVRKKDWEQDRKKAEQGFCRVKEVVASGTFDIIILDEIIVAVHLKLINEEDVLALMKDKPAHTELILTGRHAPEKIMDAADLVTEMREIKHYFSKGIQARKGIEH